MMRYFGNFQSREDIASEFGVDASTVPADGAILFAAYGTPSYEGYAHVLYRDGERLMEVQGSHCSCYGLEGQWQPDEVSVPQLVQRGGLPDYHEYGADALAAWDALVAELAAA